MSRVGRRRDVRRGAPVALLPFAAVGLAFVVVPLLALLQRTPWSELGDLVTDPVVTDALGLSVVTALAATVCSLVLGVPLAWVLARSTFPGRSLLRAQQPCARSKSATGFVVPFSVWGVIVANTFVAMPFLVVTVESGLRSADVRYEDAAATLGAGRWLTFRRITLPNVLPSIVAGAVLCWARALGEFGATVTFAGNLQGRTQTMPLAVFLALETDRDAAIALSLLLIVVSLAVLVPLRDRWLR